MEKSAVRRHCRTYRTNLSDDRHAALCRRIAVRLAQLPELAAADVVHAYWPHSVAREVDIRPVLCYLRALGRTIGLPVVDFACGEPRMAHRVWTSETQMQTNRWGMLEPVTGQTLLRSEVDAVLVPALGVDAHGHRVGYGKGYYDRFLSGIDAVFICPMFAECRVPCIKTEPHDVSMDVIVTERDEMRPAA
ncbi:MAG: 5-formyltetrahydrofolate cyclo-ligase [Bacteroidota bacterium]|nr:5-formyltetrahydrofolate cyclo-ligase [Bacteroidota bacterium]